VTVQTLLVQSKQTVNEAEDADKFAAAHLEQRAPFLRRLAAVTLYDYIACLWLVTIAVVACRTVLGADGARLTAHAPIQTLTLIVFLFRDSFFNGRGLGKSLLGLALVDQQTRRPATVVQVLLRNLVFFAPYFAYQLAALLGRRDMLTSLNIFAVAYTFLILLVETVLMLRGSGLRLADKLSGTMVVQLKTQDLC
jgi:uncharacterized RDD family membrane protein YckC